MAAEALRAAGANPLCGTNVNADVFALAAQPVRAAAMGKRRPALVDAMKEQKLLGGGYAAARPLMVKHAEAQRQQKLAMAEWVAAG